MDIEKSDEVLDSLLAFKELFEQDDSFKVFLLNFNITLEKKLGVIEKVLPDKSVQELLVRFFELVFKHGRIESIVEIVDDFVELKKKLSGEIDAVVYSPYALTKKDIESIANVIKEKLHYKAVNVEVIEDKTLVGGILLNVDGKIYDGSVKGELEKLAKVLRGE